MCCGGGITMLFGMMDGTHTLGVTFIKTASSNQRKYTTGKIKT